MDQANVTKRQRRKLPVRKIVDAELVSNKADSDRAMDDLLFPSEKDRIILSEIFDSTTIESHLNLPRVVLGVPKKRELKANNTITNKNKTYKERLKEQQNSAEQYLDLSGHSIIPTKKTQNDPHHRDKQDTNVTTNVHSNNNQEQELDSEIEELNIHTNQLELHNNDTRSHEGLDITGSQERIHQKEVDTVHLEKEVESDNDSHCYEQQVYVVIESLDTDDSLDYSSNSSSSSSEPENDDGSLYESDVSDESIKQQDASVKMKSEVVEDTLIQLPKPKVSANIPFSQDIKTQEDAEIDTDSDIQDNSVKEEAIATVPEITTATIPDITMETKSNASDSNDNVPDKNTTSSSSSKMKHAKLKRLRYRKALDWIENTSITNTSPKGLSGRISKIAYHRKERLSARRNKPYITKKKFRASVWE